MSFTFTTLPGVVGPISLSPWVNLDKVWTAVMGYPADEFRFIDGKTRLSTLAEAGSICVLYLMVVLGGREVMRNQPAFKLDTLFKIHNLLLTLVSAALLILFTEQMVPSLWKHGLYDNICGEPGLAPRLTLLYYLNYCTKYWELFDTVFLVLRKKPLTFLHCYHHPVTAFLCITQLVGRTPVSWLPIVLNLTVHVLMYWYYFQSARGIRVTWKQWITRLQISQFVIDLGFVYFGTYDYLMFTYFPSFPHIGQCGGAVWAAITGDLILLSYLILFIFFYMSTYQKQSPQNLNGKNSSTISAGVSLKGNGMSNIISVH